MNYAVFIAPGKGSYIETYLTITGNSVIYKKIKQGLQSKIQVEIKFSRGDSLLIENGYILVSPQISDSTIHVPFIDLHRYSIKPGSYDMHIRLHDLYSPESEALEAAQPIQIAAEGNAPSFSDIELAESFTKTLNSNTLSKSGIDLVPYVLRYYPESVNKLIFYVEAYHLKERMTADPRLLYVSYVEGSETNEKVTGFYSFKRQNVAEVNPLLNQFDITELPTGSYNLVVEVRDTKNELIIIKKLPFSRLANKVKYKISDLQTIDTTGTFISKVTNPDTLRDYILCLNPISTTNERDWQFNQVNRSDIRMMQQYIYAFWANRDPINPEKSWIVYRAQALKIKKDFACGGSPGYMSDRGRVYLQYGAPSASQQFPADPDSYPYEIWQYYRIKDPATGNFQSNKKFVFYNPQLDGHCYQLLHSDARGETRDDRWQIKLQQRTNQILNLDQNTPTNGTYGSNADDVFQNPR